MKIGKRIRFFRELRGMTQQELGTCAGLSKKTGGVRVAQYETGARTPKAALQRRFADALGVSPDALNIPGLDTPAGVMHTLFALEVWLPASPGRGERWRHGRYGARQWTAACSPERNMTVGGTGLPA